MIIVLVDDDLTAEITELATSAPLPTKVRATRAEGLPVCIGRAKALIDRYVEGAGRT